MDYCAICWPKMTSITYKIFKTCWAGKSCRQLKTLKINDSTKFKFLTTLYGDFSVCWNESLEYASSVFNCLLWIFMSCCCFILLRKARLTDWMNLELGHRQTYKMVMSFVYSLGNVRNWFQMFDNNFITKSSQNVIFNVKVFDTFGSITIWFQESWDPHSVLKFWHQGFWEPEVLVPFELS